MKKIPAFFVCILCGLLASVPARASTLFDFSFYDTGTGGSIISASGVLTTSPLGSNFLITDITGMFNGNPISSLVPPGGYASNNNVLYSGIPSLDFSGVSFVVPALAPLENVNVYFDGPGLFVCAGCYAVFNGDFDLAINFSVDAATPLPAALPLFATGLGVLGALSWRRKRRFAA